MRLPLFLIKPLLWLVLPAALLLPWLLQSCGDSEVSRSLAEIESYMDSQPDSRLAELQALDSAGIGRRSDRMLYEVLLTQALDKAHGSIAGRDSIMAVASDWFERRGDVRRTMLAHYFLGRSNFEKGDYTECLVAMFKAHDLAKELDDKYWTGMSARGIADVYAATYNSADAVRYAEIELENLRLSGRQPYVDDAISDLARAYSNDRNYKMAYAKAYELIDSAKKHEDSYLLNEGLKIVSVTLMAENRHVEALPFWKKVTNAGYASDTDSMYYAIALANSGRADEAIDIFDKSQSGKDFEHWLKYEIYSNLGMQDSAFFHLEKEYHALNTKFRKRFNVSLLSSISSYYGLLNRMNEERVESSKMLTWSLVVIVLLIICIGTIVSVRYYRASRERMERNLMMTQNLRDMLSQKVSECDEARDALRSKLKSEFTIFDELCKKFYESESPAVARKRIASAVNDLISQISSNEKKIAELELAVDMNYENVMTEFKIDFPNLKDVDYKLFLYSAYDLSLSTISVLLHEEKLSNIYERKRRLKDRIKKSGGEKMDKYLTILG